MSSNDALLSTYRVQLGPDFTFDHVARIAPYLAELGISHVYCSPYLQAYPGSAHGYDVVDHSELNPQLGGRAAFDRMVTALAEHGLGHIVDVVPNHVSIEGVLNGSWWDVLKHGRDSRFEPYFDIDWDTDIDDLTGKVLVPILGGPLDEVLERNELSVEGGTEPVLRYFDHRLPLAPGTEEGDVADVVRRQHYLPAHWKRAVRHLNYRRFFDITTLAAIRAEASEVFDEVHGLVLDLMRDGKLDGLRIDHIDGLRDPRGYLERLRGEGVPYIVVEKILEPGESLPSSWPVDGTTGYDFLNNVGGLFVDPAGAEPLTRVYASQTGGSTDLDAVEREKKMLVMRHVMVSDINRLVRDFLRVPAHAGLDEDEARVAIAETIASMHVYRTYARPDGSISDEDKKVVEDAVASAGERAGYIPEAVFDALRAALSMEAPSARDFALRFQQTTGPIMAKGVEDTVFYNYNRLVSLNEVGGSPGRFGVGVDEFHDAAARTREEWPRTIVTTATHDTKRSEDVRARIALLSEIPERWAEAVERWTKIANRHRSGKAPDGNAVYLFFQTLVGTYPWDVGRAVTYMLKTAREAKRYTSWLDPRPQYEEALERFVRATFSDEEFMAEVRTFVKPLVAPGRINSLAQTLVKLTHPGIPDTYQGTELWDDSLVDPDNRRPVDYELRAGVLRRALSSTAADLWPRPDDGAAKMLVTARALNLRKERPGSLGPEGSYTRLDATGERADHVVAFLRGQDVAVVVPRLVMGLGNGWGDTSIELPPGRWRNVLTEAELDGGLVPLQGPTSAFPVALLSRNRDTSL